jgi:hypothetical protein
LFEARCKDFKIPIIPTQEVRFIQTLKKCITNRKLTLFDLGLNVESGKVVQTILKKHKNFSVFNFRKNLLGLGGYSSLLPILKNSTSLVSIDLGSNELQGEGMIKVIEAIGKSKSIISVGLGSQEPMGKNKINVTGCESL